MLSVQLGETVSIPRNTPSGHFPSSFPCFVVFQGTNLALFLLNLFLFFFFVVLEIELRV
jgi:hypothetical protein